MLIYAPKNSPRLQYTLDLVFHNLLQVSYTFTNDKETFTNYREPKVNYGGEKSLGGVMIYADKLLFEQGIEFKKIKSKKYENTKIIFFHDQAEYDLPFDVFAASFFMVSRYEEYWVTYKDRYGRYPATESIAYKQNFLHQAVVNRWVEMFKQQILQKYPVTLFPERKFEFTPTYDIDSAFAYLGKGIVRNVGSILKSIITQFDLPGALSQIQVLSGLRKDPFDTYLFQIKMQKKFGLKPIYFFLVGDYNENDKNLPIHEPIFKSLIKSMADYAAIGLHPSFASSHQPEKIRIEKNRLSETLNREITKSRQHFLILRFPESYTHLLEIDIEEDYTMGYASQLGFRAGIANSFYWYNISIEASTNLKVYPFALMDATLRYYLKKTPVEALKEMKNIVNEVADVKGHLITLFHNESLSDQGAWQGWKKKYEAILSYIRLKLEEV